MPLAIHAAVSAGNNTTDDSSIERPSTTPAARTVPDSVDSTSTNVATASVMSSPANSIGVRNASCPFTMKDFKNHLPPYTGATEAKYRPGGYCIVENVKSRAG